MTRSYSFHNDWDVIPTPNGISIQIMLSRGVLTATGSPEAIREFESRLPASVLANRAESDAMFREAFETTD